MYIALGKYMFSIPFDHGILHSLGFYFDSLFILDYILIFTFLTGFYAPCSHAQVPNHLTLLAESFPPELCNPSLSEDTVIRGNRNRCPVPGVLYNTNTLESFHALDKQSLLKAEVKKVHSKWIIQIRWILIGESRFSLPTFDIIYWFLGLGGHSFWKGREELFSTYEVPCNIICWFEKVELSLLVCFSCFGAWSSSNLDHRFKASLRLFDSWRGVSDLTVIVELWLQIVPLVLPLVLFLIPMPLFVFTGRVRFSSLQWMAQFKLICRLIDQWVYASICTHCLVY